MGSFLQDFKYGIRMLMKRRGFTTIALLTLAIGIGANTAIFSLVHAVLIRPLPYAEPDRLVSLWETTPVKSVSRSRVAPGTFLDWRTRSQSFEDVAAFSSASLTLTGAGEPEQLSGARVSDEYFVALGVQPILGRVFRSDEHGSGHNRVVILDHGFWQRRFGSKAGVIGTALLLDGIGYEVVGVMPPGIYPTQPATVGRMSFEASQQQFFVPMTLEGEWAENRRSHVLGVIARLKRGVSFEQAQAEMTALGAALAQDYVANRGEGIVVTKLLDEVVGKVRPAMLVLFGAVGAVLLIACANVAALLLANINSRRREIAVRCALGAGRGRIIRQFLSEGLVLSLAGAALGVWLASFGVNALMQIIPVEIPRIDQVAIDSTALAFTLMLSILTSVLISLVPALQASKPDLQAALKESTRSYTGRERFRRALVVGQIALAVVLVIGATLLVQSFRRLRSVDLGFNPEHVLVASVALPQSKYGEWQRISAFYGQLLDALGKTPGVRVSATAYDHPLETNWIDSFMIEGRPQAEQTLTADLHLISPDYFAAVGTSLVDGRVFRDQDDPDHPGAMIINEAFAARYFPDEDALGKRIATATPSRMVDNHMPGSFEIVGMVRDVKSHGVSSPAEPAYYIPARQFPQSNMQVLVRTEGDALAMASVLRNQVSLLDPDQPVSDITTLEKLFSNAVAAPRFNAQLMGMFGMVALLLSAIGIYGLLAHNVTARTPEIGIRMALGAKPGDVQRLVIGQGMKLALVGVAIGLGAAMALTRLMTSLLYGVSPTDPATFTTIAALLMFVALLACYVPARRATKVDPMIALRYE